ncbi:MAG TPA: hypothetical protein VHL77_12840, partial [Ferruginibacter sp.]|nr:hypothetical protein [Ferruginibacter sp.]
GETILGAPIWISAQTFPGLTLNTTPLAVGSGGTGASTVDTARAALGFAPVDDIVTVSGTSLTLDSTHIYKYVRFTSNSAVTVTVPTSVYTKGQYTNFMQAGTGKVTFTQSSTTIFSLLSNKALNAAGSCATLKCTVNSTDFDLFGTLQP